MSIEHELREAAKPINGWANPGRADLMLRAADELSWLREANRKLRNALEPFADIAEIEDEVGRNDPEDDRIWISQAYGCQLAELSVEDFKAVARALSEREGQDG